MSRADTERAQLRAIAETHESDEVAVASLLLGHAALDHPRQQSWWVCGCGHPGRLGESHAKHQAQQVLALLDRRREVAWEWGLFAPAHDMVATVDDNHQPFTEQTARAAASARWRVVQRQPAGSWKEVADARVRQ